MDLKNKMLLHMLYLVSFQTVSSQSLREASTSRIMKRLNKLEVDVLVLKQENDLCKEDMSTLTDELRNLRKDFDEERELRRVGVSDRLTASSGQDVRHGKEQPAIAQRRSCDCDAIVREYKNVMHGFKSEKSVNMMFRKQIDEIRKEHDFEIENVREMFNNVVSILTSTDRILRSDIDTIKNEIEGNLSAAKNLAQESYVVCQKEINDTRAYFNDVMLGQKFEEMSKERDFEIRKLREMYNDVVSRLSSTERTLHSEIETIKNEKKENWSAAQKLVHDSYVVCQKEINDTRAYFNDALLRNKFDEMRKEHDFEIGKFQEKCNNFDSLLNSAVMELRSEINTLNNETNENFSTVQKLVHDSNAVCQKEINHMRAYFKNGLLQVNESLMDRSLNASKEISQITSDIVNLNISNEILKNVTENLKFLHYHPCDTVERSGEYKIYPISHPNGIRVYCKKDSTNKGWIVMQRRTDGSVNFNRTWADYKAGFGDLSGDFWLGNENIHQLTKDKPRELRIDMETFDGKKRYALYSKFSISSESDKYKLHVADYTGDAVDDLNVHNGQSFSTFDADNDVYMFCCACAYGGGWWYHNCFNINLNGRYVQRSDTGIHYLGISWYNTAGYVTSLKFVTMSIR